MLSKNKVILIGNIGKDPETKHLDGGKQVTNLTLATNETYKNASGEKVKNTEWHRLVLWGKLSEIADKYVTKGGEIYVEGKMTYRKYTDKNGTEKISPDVVVNELQLGGKAENKSQDNQQQNNSQQSNQSNNDEDTGDLPF